MGALDSDPGPDSGSEPGADDLIAELDDADAALDRARRRVEAVGEAELERLADAYDELTGLFDRYEERVTGDGDFGTFIEFQGEVADFTERLPEDLRHRGVFEDADDLLQQRRLTESDWERVRETLAPVREDVGRLDERADARERYRDARNAVERRLSTVEDRIADLERLRRLGEADLDAPVERLRGPIRTYNERVRETFGRFRSESGAREVLGFVAATEAYPLVRFRQPPEELRAFVERHEAGAEPVTQLLEYADFSRSKLDHYVGNPDALKRNVATHRTYLRRLDAGPLTVAWPPPAAGTLRYRCRELTGVVARLPGADTAGADDATGADAPDPLVALRKVRALPRETDYERLRESAQARERLGDEERERLASGAVGAELDAYGAIRERLEGALGEYPDPDR